jgi:DNA invertase Pin-like site-specific DNA recombinase
MNRPNLDRLIEDIRNNMVDVIVSIKVDRLTRDGYDGQWLLKFCNENDVILDLLYEQYDINTVNGEMH